MKRSERHHLKQDELVSSLEQFLIWAAENQKHVVNGVLVAVGAGLLLGGLYTYRSRQSSAAQASLASALEQFHAPVRPDGGAGTSDELTFQTSAEKYRRALESFQGVLEQYGSYDAGRQARYYAALCHENLGDLEAAEEALSELRTGNRDLLYYLASRALAAVKAERDDLTGAAELYRTLIEDADNPLPKDHLLFALAKTEERAGNTDQARLYYDRMLAEHPESQLRGDALARSEALEFESRISG